VIQTARTRTIGDVRAATEHWQLEYRDAAEADRGGRLLSRAAGVAWRSLLVDEVNALVLNLSFVLLSERVALWDDAGQPVPPRVWQRLLRYLRSNRYGQQTGRYLVSLHGAGTHPLAITAGSLAGARPDVRVGDLYGALGFDLVGVSDRSGPWSRGSARRVGQSLLEALGRDHRLELRVSLGADELLVGIQTDHDRVEPLERLDRATEAVANALRSNGRACGAPELVARNARALPLAGGGTPDGKGDPRPILVLLPEDGRRGDVVPSREHDLVLLPTPRVLADYAEVVALTQTRALAAAAQRAGVPITSFDELLREHHRRTLEWAIRDLRTGPDRRPHDARRPGRGA